eukprot:gene12271-12408_t
MVGALGGGVGRVKAAVQLLVGGCLCEGVGSNVMPLEVNLHLDYFTSSRSSALRAVFGGWSLPQCKE